MVISGGRDLVLHHNSWGYDRLSAFTLVCNISCDVKLLLVYSVEIFLMMDSGHVQNM